MLTNYFSGHIHDLFHAIEKYSPFHDFLESDEDYIARLRAEHEAAEARKKSGPPAVRVLSKEELAKYDGSEGSPGIYLALLGVVYDVSKGSSYYGPGGGYSFFSGKDGSRAFVTGQFDTEGLVETVEGLAPADYLGLQEWSEFYSKDYTRVGVLEGLYYNSKGEVTEEWKKVQRWIQEARNEKDKQDVEKQVFPPCNVEWSKEKGSRYWCSIRSGGVTRNWAGVPRRLFYPGRDERCACIRNSGPPSTDPGASSDRGDLDSPHVKEYDDCQPDSTECWKQ